MLNVGGTLHQVRWETIEKFPKSRLHCLRFAITEGKLISKIYWWFNKFLLDEIISLCDAYSLRNREFFFDRSPRVFEYILGIYRKGNTSKQNEWKIVKIIFSHYTSASASTKTLSLYSFYLKCSEGELHLPSSVCPRDFLGELEYWGLSALHLGLHFNLVKLQSNVMQNIFTIQRI